MEKDIEKGATPLSSSVGSAASSTSATALPSTTALSYASTFFPLLPPALFLLYYLVI